MPAGPSSREGAFKKDEYVAIRKATVKWDCQGSEHVPVLVDLRPHLHPSMRAARILGDESYKIVVVSLGILKETERYTPGALRNADVKQVMEHVVRDGFVHEGKRCV